MEIKIAKSDRAAFNNHVTYCVGTGRMGLALQKEYFEQLAFVQREIGFEHIRGHGLFCDDMAIYQEHTDKEGNRIIEYNFTYLDLVIDSYLSVGIKPFLELGFMPYKLASGENYVFRWKGNTTPPKSYDDWCALISATLNHFIERYGENEATSWPVEVWNEPNLSGFWYKADMEEYFKLYEISAKAVKAVNEKFRVGGPAICGGADEKWMRGFLNFCRKANPPLDFITRHHYTIHQPEHIGHYGYAKLMDTDYCLQTLRDVKAIIAEYPEFKELPFYITEFNTAYIPNSPLHDTNQNAAEIARTLSEIGDYAQCYSYWTFGDIFEESGVPHSLFHGGFGLVANGSVPKPTFYTFKFFKNLTGECLYRDEHCVIVKQADGEIRGVLWNVYRDTKDASLDIKLDIEMPGGDYLLVTHTVDEKSCNPLKAWHDMGEPKYPSADQLDLIRSCAKPYIETDRLSVDSQAKLEFELCKNAVVYFELKAAPMIGDRGYDYERVVTGEN